MKCSTPFASPSRTYAHSWQEGCRRRVNLRHHQRQQVRANGHVRECTGLAMEPPKHVCAACKSRNGSKSQGQRHLLRAMQRKEGGAWMLGWCPGHIACGPGGLGHPHTTSQQTHTVKPAGPATSRTACSHKRACAPQSSEGHVIYLETFPRSGWGPHGQASISPMHPLGSSTSCRSSMANMLPPAKQGWLLAACVNAHVAAVLAGEGPVV